MRTGECEWERNCGWVGRRRQQSSSSIFPFSCASSFLPLLAFFPFLFVCFLLQFFLCLSLLLRADYSAASLSLRGLLLIYKVIAAAAAAQSITTKRFCRGGGRGSSFNQKQQQQKTQFPIKSTKCSIEANFYGRPTPTPCLSLHLHLLLPSAFCHSDHSFNNCFCLLPAVIVVGSLFMCACVCVNCPGKCIIFASYNNIYKQ